MDSKVSQKGKMIDLPKIDSVKNNVKSIRNSKLHFTTNNHGYPKTDSLYE